MEIIALLYFAIIPGCVIGFLVGFFWFFRKWNFSGRFLISIVSGLALGYFSPCIISMPHQIRSNLEKRKIENVAVDEAVYFKSAIEGQYKDDDIKEHYKRNPITWLGENKITQALYESTQSSNITKSKFPFITNIQQNKIPLMIETFENKPRIAGLLVALPNVPLDLKYKIADSKEPVAVMYLASDERTPSDILLKLATHPTTNIARSVFYNKNAPQTARYIYSIRAPYSEDWRHHDEGNNPPGFGSDEEKTVWRSLSKDNRDYVRTWVARSQVTPPQVLTDLANDQNEDILQWVVLNNNSTQYTKNKAARNLSNTVRGLISKLSESSDREIREAVARSHDTPIETLKSMCQDRDEKVLRAIVDNPRIMPEILEILGASSSHLVLVAVAKHPKTPIAVLKKLLNTSVSHYKIPEVAADNLFRRGQDR